VNHHRFTLLEDQMGKTESMDQMVVGDNY